MSISSSRIVFIKRSTYTRSFTCPVERNHRVSSPEIYLAKSRTHRWHLQFNQCNALEDVGLKMCESPYHNVGMLHLAVRCNPWKPYVAVASAIAQACLCKQISDRCLVWTRACADFRFIALTPQLTKFWTSFYILCTSYP